MNTRPSALVLLVFLPFLLAGCAGDPPVRELRLYESAFSDARSAGEQVLDDAAAAIEIKESKERALVGGAEGLYPQTFDPTRISLDPNDSQPEVIRVRRLAFQTVANYNDTLLALAEGRTLDELQGRVATLGNTVQSLLPLVGLAGGPLPGLALAGLQSAIAVAEKARERAVIEQAILEGHDDIGGILEALIADTPDLYALQRARWELELDAADKEMGDLRRSMISLAKAHESPSDPDEVKTIAGIEQRVDRAFASTSPPSDADSLPTLVLKGTPDGAAFNDALAGDLDAQAGRIEAAAARYARGVQAVNLVHAAMKQYVLLLLRARQSLDALRAAVIEPPDANDVLVRVVESGVELRRQAGQVQEIFRALKAR